MRPTEYKLEYCELIKELMSEGASLEEVASTIGVTKKTLYNWTKKHKEFLHAKRIGEQLSLGWWFRQGRINLENKDFSATLFYMNMKNRFGWADKNNIDHTTKGDKLPTPIYGGQSKTE